MLLTVILNGAYLRRCWLQQLNLLRLRRLRYLRGQRHILQLSAVNRYNYYSQFKWLLLLLLHLLEGCLNILRMLSDIAANFVGQREIFTQRSCHNILKPGDTHVVADTNWSWCSSCSGCWR